MLRELRRFSKTDWYGFAGAEPFSNGKDPFWFEADLAFWPRADAEHAADMCGEKIDPVIFGIIDRIGIGIFLFENFFILDLADNEIVCLSVLKELAKKPIDSRELPKWGFKFEAPSPVGRGRELNIGDVVEFKTAKKKWWEPLWQIVSRIGRLF